MKKKLFKSLLLSCTLALTVPTLAFAGNWKQDLTAGGINMRMVIILSIPG